MPHLSAPSSNNSYQTPNKDNDLNRDSIQSVINRLTRDIFILTHTIDLLERYTKKKGVSVGGSDMVKWMDVFSSSRTRSLSLESGSPAGISLVSSGIFYSARGSSDRSNYQFITSAASMQEKISIKYMKELVDREIHDCNAAMEKIRNRFKSSMFLLQAEEENFKADTFAVEEGNNLLNSFLSDEKHIGVKTGLVLYDKFTRFVEHELEIKDRELRKIKLKVGSLQNEYNNIKSKQQRKLELQENLHAIDVGKLRIENKEHLEIFTAKTDRLIDLKTLTGRKNQQLVSFKSRLNDSILALKNIKQDVKQKEAKYAVLTKKEDENTESLLNAQLLNRNIKLLNESYKSPDVHSYMMMETKIEEIKREKEIWVRRCRDQQQTMNLLENQVKKRFVGENPLYISRSRSLFITPKRSSVRSLPCGFLMSKTGSLIPQERALSYHGTAFSK